MAQQFQRTASNVPMSISVAPWKRLHRLLFPFLLAVLLVPSVAWVIMDLSVWPWDQAWYGEVSVDLYYVLRTEPLKWLSAMIAAFGSKPPAIAYSGQFAVPLARFFGRVEPALLMTVLACQAGSLWFVWDIGQRLCQERRIVSAAGTLALGSAPLFVGIGHQYLAEAPQTLAVSWIYWLALASPNMRRPRLLSGLMAAVALGMLAKTTTPLYCLFAGLIALCVLLRSGVPVPLSRTARWLDGALLVVAGALLALTVAWYWKNFVPALQHARISASSEIAMAYGRRGTLSTKLCFWLGQSSNALLADGTILLCVAATVLLRVFQRPSNDLLKMRPLSPTGKLVAAAAVLQVAAVLVVFSFQDNEETRYLVPMLPLIAILVMWLLAAVGTSTLAWSLSAALLVQAMIVNAKASGLGMGKWVDSVWLHPIHRDARDYARISAIVALTCPQTTANHYAIIGVEYPSLNANSAAFFTAKQRVDKGWRCYYTSLGYAESNPERAYRRLFDTNATFLVTESEDDQVKPADAFNAVSLPVLRRVMTSPDFAIVQPPIDGVLIFRRKQ